MTKYPSPPDGSSIWRWSWRMEDESSSVQCVIRALYIESTAILDWSILFEPKINFSFLRFWIWNRPFLREPEKRNLMVRQRDLICTRVKRTTLDEDTVWPGWRAVLVHSLVKITVWTWDSRLWRNPRDGLVRWYPLKIRRLYFGLRH